MNETILEVSKIFQVRPGDILSKSRKMPLPTARFFCYGILYAKGYDQGTIAKKFKCSQPAISRGITNFLQLNKP